MTGTGNWADLDEKCLDCSFAHFSNSLRTVSLTNSLLEIKRHRSFKLVWLRLVWRNDWFHIWLHWNDPGLWNTPYQMAIDSSIDHEDRSELVFNKDLSNTNVYFFNLAWSTFWDRLGEKKLKSNNFKIINFYSSSNTDSRDLVIFYQTRFCVIWNETIRCNDD